MKALKIYSTIKRSNGSPVAAGFRGSFLLKQSATYASSSRSVDGFKVSKSISISSGLESFRLGSRDWIIVTTWPNLSPEQHQNQYCVLLGKAADELVRRKLTWTPCHGKAQKDPSVRTTKLIKQSVHPSPEHLKPKYPQYPHLPPHLQPKCKVAVAVQEQETTTLCTAVSCALLQTLKWPALNSLVRLHIYHATPILLSVLLKPESLLSRPVPPKVQSVTD